MFYITKLPSGIAKVWTYPPLNQPCIELEDLPEGFGILRFDKHGELYYEHSNLGAVEEVIETPSDVDERLTELEDAFDILTEGLL